MKISWVKQENDNENFITIEKLGMNVYKLENPEEVDNAIKQLISEDYKTIILSNEIAGFSEDIIKKYQNNNKVNIIITPRR